MGKINGKVVDKPGYKHTALGWIPEDWEVVQLSKAIKLINGKAFKPGDWKKQGLPIIRIQNLNDLHAEFNYCDKPVEEKYYVQDGDVLFAWSGTKGVSFGARIWDRGLALLNQHIFKIVTKVDILSNEFSYLVLKKVQDSIEAKAHGFKSSFVHVKKFDLDKTLLPIPPLPEQRKIWDVFKTWNVAISNTDRLIKLCIKRRKALMQQLLTGKKRLPGFGGEWEYKKIGSFAKEVSIRNRDDKELIVLSCTKYNGLVSSLEYFGRKIFADDLTTYKIVPNGCFAYATNHIEEGSIGYQHGYDEALISPMYTVFKTDNTINDSFLFSVLKSYPYLHEYQKRMEGSIDRRGGLRWEEFAKIKVPSPSLEEQAAIVDVLQTADKEIQLLQQKLDGLKEQKKGLMQQLLTGKKRVKF